MAKILVSGAAGFIGFHLCRRLLARGDQVVGLDNLNDYYDVRLKHDRLAVLLAEPGFSFHRQSLELRPGMQRLFEGSEEAPDCPGLGVLAGRCYRLSGGTGSARLKIPHVGWNSLAFCRDASIVDGVPRTAQVYFTHSFAAPVTPDTVAWTEHGERFAAIVDYGQISGVQFHPEKSGEVGLQILRNFVRSAR